MTLRLGLAGVGIHGGRYARHLLEGDVAGARLTAICRKDASRGRDLADRHGLSFVAHPSELADHPAVDAVVLALPPDLHETAATACVENDRPVLVEKPLAHDLAGASRLTRIVEERGALLMVAQTLRFDPLVQLMRRRVTEIGALRTIYVNQRAEPAGLDWHDEAGPGGMLLNMAVHGFDLIRFLGGLEARSVSAEIQGRRMQRTEDELAMIVRLDPGDVLAVLEYARTTSSRSGSVELTGESGQLCGDHIHRTLFHVRGRERSDLGPVDPAPTVPRLLESFVHCVVAQTRPEVVARDGLATLELVEATRIAAREGRRVELSELRD